MVGAGHCFHGWIGIESKDQGIVQTARSLQHRTASATATQDRDAQFAAGRDIDLALEPIRIAQDDEVILRLPEPKHFRAIVLVAPVEQRLVAGKILLGRWPCQVEVFHVFNDGVLKSKRRIAAPLLTTSGASGHSHRARL